MIWNICVAGCPRDEQAILEHCFPECALHPACDLEQILAVLESFPCDILFVDLGLFPSRSRRAAMESIRAVGQGIPFILLAPPSRVREAVVAVRAGADNYLTRPLISEEVHYVAESLLELKRFEAELATLRDAFWRHDPSGIAHTNSPLMRQVFAKAKAVAPTSTLVLLTGETGTGKSAMARLIHDHSARADRQFISVHCGAIPDTLIESELFGHEKGAFTGAQARKQGTFELAHGGTILLDEIGTLSPTAQVKLLQVLQDRTFHRVGGIQEITADVRVIAATNADLRDLSRGGFFRPDLYYRLNVFPLEIPPLRERREDIPILVRTFLRRLNREHGREIQGLDPGVTEALQVYDWPGNVRELENLIERAFILESSRTLTPESFPAEIFPSRDAARDLPPDTSMTLAAFRAKAVKQAECLYLRELLARNRGRMNHSAQEAGITTRQLRKLILRHRLRKEDFKSL